jgi:hypothetical protein
MKMEAVGVERHPECAPGQGTVRTKTDKGD